MVSPSRAEKSEQLVNVATHIPTTAHMAARRRKEGRAESMTCTIILIQKTSQPAQLDGLAARDTRDLRDRVTAKSIHVPPFAPVSHFSLHAPRGGVDSPAPLG